MSLLREVWDEGAWQACPLTGHPGNVTLSEESRPLTAGLLADLELPESRLPSWLHLQTRIR